MEELNIENFRWRNKKKNWKQSYCKKCSAKFDVETKQNPNYFVRRRADRRRHRDIKRAFIKEFFKTHPCIDCGEVDPIVLEFDHVRGEKKFNIADEIGKRTGIARLIKEIEKCDVRCANCHRRKTTKEFGYSQWLLD